MVKPFLKGANIEAKVMAVGSTAKDTFVSGSTDIDIFVVSSNYRSAYDLIKNKIKNGSRKEGPMDIWHFTYKGYDVDLVFIPPDHPRIETLEHTAFMNRNLTAELKKEVIKAKAFFKSHGVYGAEIGGIVGIAVEELIRRYHTLENICKVFSKYETPPFIEDPVNPKRNILASIKPIRWKQLQSSCKKFLENGQIKFKPYTKMEYIREKITWHNLFFNRKRDRATDFHTALSVCNHALNEIKNREPQVKGNCDAYVFDNVIISYHIHPKKLPKTKVYCGPPITMKDAVEAFKEVHPKTFVKNGYICTIIEREKTDIEKWMKEKIVNRMRNKNYLPISPL
jgi:tRNA nucleotidyltransferase (CCA-adding enzyme)